MMHNFKPAEFHATCQLRGHNFVSATERFHITQGKLLLQHVPYISSILRQS